MTAEEIVAKYAATLHETYRKTNNRVTHAYVEASARSEMEKDINAAVAERERAIVELKAKNERLRKALEFIANATGAMPAAFCDEASWFRSQFYRSVGEATQALHHIEGK